MGLSYDDSANLMRDAAFMGRIKVACLQFAAYISNEAGNIPAHNTRYRWALNTLNAPDTAANSVTPTVVMDPAVQDKGTAILDKDLQSAVENAVNKLM